MVFKIPILFILASFTQAQIKDCTGALSKVANNEKITNAEISYDAEITQSANIGSGWKSVFKTNDDVNCQVRKCVLMNKFCIDPYDGNKVAIGDSYPWQITAMTYDKLGYSESFCLFCSIDAIHIYQDITVKQVSKCSPNISTTVKNKQNTIRYSSDSPSVNIGNGWSSLFKNANKDGCPFTSCSLKSDNCTKPYTDKTFTISQNSPFIVSAKRQNLGGYEESVCVECLIQEDLSEIQNTVSVKQVGKLEVARLKFINYFAWDMIHGMLFKKLEECEKSCSQLFWKSNCCAKVKMAGIDYQTGIEDSTRTDYYCLNQAQADGNYKMTFDDVDVNIQCENTLSGAKVLAGINIALVSLIAFGY